MALSTHSAALVSLAGKIVRSLPLLKSHRRRRASGRGLSAEAFSRLASSDLLALSTGTSEPSSENSSPPATAESDSTASGAERGDAPDELRASLLDSFS